jgi:hypothetical protein
MTGIIPIIIGAVVGAIFSGWIAWLIAKRTTEQTILASLALDRIQSRDKAAALFRLEFLDLILVLKGITDLDDMPKAFVSYINKFYHKHSAAVITFIPYLDKVRVERINSAWFDYCYPNGIKEGTKDEQKYAFPLGDYADMPEERAKRIVLEKIEKLLSISGHINSFP